MRPVVSCKELEAVSEFLAETFKWTFFIIVSLLESCDACLNFFLRSRHGSVYSLEKEGTTSFVSLSKEMNRLKVHNNCSVSVLKTNLFFYYWNHT